MTLFDIFIVPRPYTTGKTQPNFLKANGKKYICIPLWQLQIGPNSCLEVEKQIFNRLILADCNKYNPDQAWAKFEVTSRGMKICKKELNQCLTLSNNLDDKKRGVALTETRLGGVPDQLWKMNEEVSLLINVGSGLCLAGIFRSFPYVSDVEAHVCSQKPDYNTKQKSRFVPLNNCSN